jgi:hypothetical protein
VTTFVSLAICSLESPPTRIETSKATRTSPATQQRRLIPLEIFRRVHLLLWVAERPSVESVCEM